MGEIIRGQFGQQRGGIEVPERDEPKRNVIEENGMTSMQNGFLKAMDAEETGDERARGTRLLSDCADRVDEMEAYIKRLANNRSTRQVLADSEQYWMSRSTEDLFKAINESSESDWERDPGRYIALGKEHTNRAKRISELFMK